MPGATGIKQGPSGTQNVPKWPIIRLASGMQAVKAIKKAMPSALRRAFNVIMGASVNYFCAMRQREKPSARKAQAGHVPQPCPQSWTSRAPR